MLLDLHNPLKLMKELKPRKEMMEEMGAAYMASGLITLAGSRMYTSMADTDEVIDAALNKFEGVLSRVEGVWVVTTSVVPALFFLRRSFITLYGEISLGDPYGKNILLE